ncbi:hypothetical protein [Bradyrhizobium genosp. P]|uniref:hypothetical protein n=1 Tax=Bradyrhizobium genosp. P TaxID=83641 RepID=UPI003CF74E6A
MSRERRKSGAVKPREDAKGLGFVEITPADYTAIEIEFGGVIIRVGAESSPRPVGVDRPGSSDGIILTRMKILVAAIPSILEIMWR